MLFLVVTNYPLIYNEAITIDSHNVYYVKL